MISASRKPSSDAAAPRRAVYDGRDKLGEIEQQGAAEYIARDQLGRSLGRFDSDAEAIEAVAAAAARDVR